MKLNDLKIKDLVQSIKTNFDFFTPHKKQIEFFNFTKDASEIALIAGNRVGKTYCGCINDVFHLTGLYPDYWQGHKFTKATVAWIVSPNYEMSRNIVQKLILSLIPKNLILKTSRLSGLANAIDYLEIKHVSGKNSICYFKSSKQGSEKFQGEKCDFIHFDEEVPYDIYKECLVRISDVGDGRGCGKIFLTMTPVRGRTELTCHYMVSKDDTVIGPSNIVDSKVYVSASWEDNPYLDKSYITLLEKKYKPYELEARKYGIPFSGVGKIYYYLEADYIIAPFKIPSHWYKFYGLDVGYTAPTAATLFAWDRDSDVLYLYGEYCQSELSSIQHAANFIKLGFNNLIGYCDPAANHANQRDGKRVIDDYRNSGLKINLVKYAKEHAVDTINERIRTGRLKIFDSCYKVRSEMLTYSRNQKCLIMKGNDHLMNAMEYCVVNGTSLATNPQYSIDSYNRIEANSYSKF